MTLRERADQISRLIPRQSSIFDNVIKARSIAAMVCGQLQEVSLWYEARLLRAEVQLAPFRHPFQCLTTQKYFLGWGRIYKKCRF
jgi:hypothetical protein